MPYSSHRPWLNWAREAGLGIYPWQFRLLTNKHRTLSKQKQTLPGRFLDPKFLTGSRTWRTARYLHQICNKTQLSTLQIEKSDQDNTYVCNKIPRSANNAVHGLFSCYHLDHTTYCTGRTTHTTKWSTKGSWRKKKFFLAQQTIAKPKRGKASGPGMHEFNWMCALRTSKQSQ